MLGSAPSAIRCSSCRLMVSLSPTWRRMTASLRITQISGAPSEYNRCWRSIRAAISPLHFPGVPRGLGGLGDHAGAFLGLQQSGDQLTELSRVSRCRYSPSSSIRGNAPAPGGRRAADHDEHQVSHVIERKRTALHAHASQTSLGHRPVTEPDWDRGDADCSSEHEAAFVVAGRDSYRSASWLCMMPMVGPGIEFDAPVSMVAVLVAPISADLVGGQGWSTPVSSLVTRWVHRPNEPAGDTRTVGSKLIAPERSFAL